MREPIESTVAQVVDYIREMIVREEIKPGARFPSERTLQN